MRKRRRRRGGVREGGGVTGGGGGGGATDDGSLEGGGDSAHGKGVSTQSTLLFFFNKTVDQVQIEGNMPSLLLLELHVLYIIRVE